MKLKLTCPRQALIIRCQAWAYANVLNGKYIDAEMLFAERLAAFDRLAEENPAHDMDYWSKHYAHSFIASCENLRLNQI